MTKRTTKAEKLRQLLRELEYNLEQKHEREQQVKLFNARIQEIRNQITNLYPTKKGTQS